MVKRLFHRIVTVLIFLVLLPAQIIISLLIVLLSGPPILYYQKRVGKNGKIFTLVKFRTMVTHADELKPKLTKYNQAKGPVFKIYDDPRFTKIGKFLSHTGLDELPQIINVMKGDMALIGPRPLPVNEAHKLMPWQQKREQIKPGIISPWIVNGYHSQSFSDWMKSDLDYVKRKSVVYDARLLFKTVRLFVFLVMKETIKIFSINF